MRKKGVLIVTGFMMRFHSYNQQIKNIIRDGIIGDIVRCNAQFTCWYPDIKGSRRQTKQIAGGSALMDLGIHCIDLIQFLSGSKIIKVASFNNTLTFNLIRGCYFQQFGIARPMKVGKAWVQVTNATLNFGIIYQKKI